LHNPANKQTNADENNLLGRDKKSKINNVTSAINHLSLSIAYYLQQQRLGTGVHLLYSVFTHTIAQKGEAIFV